MRGTTDIPSWLGIIRTMFIPKNRNTHQPENYRPIALQNNMYKLYTSVLNYFLQGHCEANNIITPHQAAAKEGSWGCTDQLLINKEEMEEVKANRKNIYCVWLDYKKAFDSVSHPWLIKSLELAKVSTILFNAVTRLTRSWSTNAYLPTNTGNIESRTTEYKRGILQGDASSVILFILQVNLHNTDDQFGKTH